jgi:anti-sigma regulatory factor (Ser/Thr protein kinase)
MSGGTGAVSSSLLPTGNPGPRLEEQPAAHTSGQWTAWLHVSVLEFVPLRTAVPSARHHARKVLRAWGFEAVAADAELALSELLTNAVTASAALPLQPRVRVKLLADPGQLVIEVFDQAPGAPTRTTAARDQPGGRRLAMVEALAHRWDWTRYPDGKLVWCDFWL